MALTQEQKVLKYIARHGIIRPRDLEEQEWSRSCLERLMQKGLIVRIGRGLYASVDARVTERRGFAEACKLVPKGVVCLLSALQFHNLTTQLPFEVWLAIDVKARKPGFDYPPLHVVRFSGAALTAGIQTSKVEGVTVRVYNVAKTVADCFKYRNKIGVDVAIEALRECRMKNLATVDELWRYASICRVANVMQPYLQAVI